MKYIVYKVCRYFVCFCKQEALPLLACRCGSTPSLALHFNRLSWIQLTTTEKPHFHLCVSTKAAPWADSDPYFRPLSL